LRQPLINTRASGVVASKAALADER
jgi:hypothetical protein